VDPLWRRVLRERGARLATAVLLILLVVAILSPWIAPYDPSAQPDIIGLKSQPPSLAHPFGTDVFSRDVLSRVMWGSRVSLTVGVLAMLVAIAIGTTYGAIAGFAGGRIDGLMMRIIDALLAMPRILLLLVVLALWGRIPLSLLIMMLGFTGWFTVSRIVRGQVRALARQEFVLSARALGVGDGRILLRHVLPNVVSPVIVAATLGIGNVILLEAGLSYLGIGVQPPQPSWGNIIQDASGQLAQLWWISLFPGLVILATVMSFNTLGDALRDAIDPRQERVR
jgi:peptide/nickel transport system permease protein